MKDGKQPKALRLGLIALVASLTLSGCVEERVVERPAPAKVVYVQSPPPAEIVEMQPPPPDGSPYWAWQKGHWRWNGQRYYWVHGKWVAKPPRYNGWVAPHWQNNGNNWFFVEGHWQ